MSDFQIQAALVFLGAGIGGFARFLTGEALRQWMPRLMDQFPWPTLLVNVVGCFLIGLISQSLKPDSRALLVTGVLGGFTTFSAFGRETVEMWTRGYASAALWYVALSLVLGIGATAVGMWISGMTHR